MPYRYDPDLQFLQYCSDRDLDDLVRILIYNKDGSLRLTEDLTYKDIYKKHQPNHSMYWQEIACEIQCFGANTVATLFRGGKGVLYREVLYDVCNKLDVFYDMDDTVENIENDMITDILGSAFKKMTPEERVAFAKEFDMTSISDFTPQALAMATQIAIKKGGFLSYKLTLIVANQIARAITGKGLQLATNATIAKSLSLFAGPIGWAITTSWTVLDIASPATRVTIPAVFEVALLRKLVGLTR
ncbi:DUF3944 domain-containing protein [Moraxella nonliquefaciens]|uniref:DUF3944 domain-containing protein n=1 Tax=Moraxella nonliquefaciens TaxID=478 RepID=A0A1B8QIF1_MORNO|nr:DUF3944 domain-containing protein [Moraxella nonliquefaciens]OBX49010.1 hypothetical protein A9Z65_01555 [Moraxella nonliquefaciens]OBX83252.1 hypothetical protein A7456_04175 [Moraxella nonliquefaciens]QPT43755.1 DUF3944 domain-containing protein [Moraxella nonliquefaciens]QQC30658.1 DUF3944 domain-containing protein [Moraxella nonliquefaciens]